MKGRRRVDFDHRCHISPYTVYRRLAENEDLLLVDLRPEGSGPRPPTLQNALERPSPGWRPPEDADAVLIDQDGARALERARELRSQGHARVWALFGGLDLWDLALGAVEEETRETGEVV